MALEDRVQLAYTAAVNTLSRQNGTLNNLRSRATALLTVAALSTSFSTGVGLLNTNHSNGSTFPTWAAYTLLGIVVVIGALCVFILWPIKDFGYDPSANYILERSDQGESVDQIARSLALVMIQGRIDNERGIDLRMKAFEVGAVLLIGEVAVLVIALAAG
jgi:hypothetical protein